MVENRFGSGLEDSDLLPYGPGLIEAAGGVFDLHSALEESGPPASSATPPCIQQLTDGMARLAAAPAPTAKSTPGPSILKRAPRQPEPAPSTKTAVAADLGSLDPAVVASARSSGIPEAHVREMAQLVAAHGGRGLPTRQEDCKVKSSFRERVRGGPARGRLPGGHQLRPPDSGRHNFDKDCRATGGEEPTSYNFGRRPRRVWISGLYREFE